MSMILSIDQSTACTKAMLWNIDGTLLARADIPHKQITNALNWVEHDPIEIYENTLTAIKTAIDKAERNAAEIAVIGISNQRETAVCWDKKTGLPLYNAIVWQCARASEITDTLSAEGLAGTVRQRTGLHLSPYFSAAKYSWIIKHIPEAATAQKSGSLCCGTIDSWLLYKLTGEFKCDYSNASRTQLLNLRAIQWDTEVAEAFGLRTSCLPEICHSDSLFGHTDLNGLLPKKIPVHCMMGDSHAALYGNQCWDIYTAKATYGTGSSVMMNAGTVCPNPIDGIAASLAWGINGKAEYVLEGNINYTGAVIKWLAEDIGLLTEPKMAGRIASAAENTGGVYLVPAFSGLSAPYYNNNARAAFLGMNRGTKREHLVRAAEECIAYQICDVVKAINESCGKSISLLRADGGPTRDEFLMKFQSDILDIPMEISETEELSAMGAAYCAAISIGMTDKQTIFRKNNYRRVNPQMDAEQRTALYEGWKNAVRTVGVC